VSSPQASSGSHASRPAPGERIAMDPGQSVDSAVALLREDHALLTQTGEALLQAITEGDREDCAQAITTLQQRLADHLDGEERELIPSYARHHPEDAARILDEHVAIRKILANLDVENDLHLVRAEALRSFLVALRAHSTRENAGLYRFAASSPTTG
jgi:hemerythrin-like domain-containing protein